MLISGPRQDVVFLVDVPMQVGLELGQPGECGSIGVAGVVGRGVVARQLPQTRERERRAVVLALHDADRVAEAPAGEVG